MNPIDDSLRIKITKINKTWQTTKHTLFITRKYYHINGICHASIDEGEIFDFEFNYTGKDNEEAYKIEDYLRNHAWNMILENRLNKNNKNTLKNYIDNLDDNRKEKIL